MTNAERGKKVKHRHRYVYQKTHRPPAGEYDGLYCECGKRKP